MTTTTKKELESAVSAIKSKVTKNRLKPIIDGVILSEAEVLKKHQKILAEEKHG